VERKESLLETWERTKEVIKKRIGEVLFKIWFSPLVAKEKDPSHLILELPNKFFYDWIKENYLPLIREQFKEILNKEIEIDLQVNPIYEESLTKTGSQVIKENITPSLNLNPRFTFENFVVGDCNRFSHAASLAVAESPAKTYNPLFIYGGVGLGKTHLIQAICHHILQRYPHKYTICYVPSERFTNELIDSIQHHSTTKFRAKYRNVDVLVIDDIHFIAGKESTQEEFFHTFNTLYDAHKQIIISSDRPPRDISRLEERLMSRFSWGLITDLQPPDLETRIAILRKKVEREPVKVPEEVINFIAEMIKTNIRELEGALIRVIAYSLLEEKPLSLDLAKDVLKDMLKERVKLITIDLIQKKVAEDFKLNLLELKSKKRNKNIVLPRQIAMYLSRELTNFSLPEIGEYFGGMDHTSVLYACDKIKSLINKDRDFKERIDRVIKEIEQ
jgi:chromosomal replication initiator protein